jgi:hypothetical protein
MTAGQGVAEDAEQYLYCMDVWASHVTNSTYHGETAMLTRAAWLHGDPYVYS